MFKYRLSDDLRHLVLQQYPFEDESDRTEREASFDIIDWEWRDGGREVTFRVGCVEWKCICGSCGTVEKLSDDRSESRCMSDLMDLVDVASTCGWKLALLFDGAFPWPNTLEEYRSQYGKHCVVSSEMQ
jgi:hypothetical protein